MVSRQLPPRKIAPQSGLGFGLGLGLVLGLGAIYRMKGFAKSDSKRSSDRSFVFYTRYRNISCP